MNLKYVLIFMLSIIFSQSICMEQNEESDDEKEQRFLIGEDLINLIEQENGDDKANKYNKRFDRDQNVQHINISLVDSLFYTLPWELLPLIIEYALFNISIINDAKDIFEGIDKLKSLKNIFICLQIFPKLQMQLYRAGIHVS